VAWLVVAFAAVVVISIWITLWFVAAAIRAVFAILRFLLRL
jgi:hypothetical protein